MAKEESSTANTASDKEQARLQQERLKNLEGAISEIKKEFGEGSITYYKAKLVERQSVRRIENA